MPHPKKKIGWRDVLYVLKPYWKTALSVLLLTIVAEELRGIAPLIEKLGFDSITGPIPHLLTALNIASKGAAVAVVAGALLILYLLISLIAYLGNIRSWAMRLNLSYNMLDAIVSRIYTLSLNYHYQNSVASLQTRIDRAVSQFCNMLFDIFYNSLPAVLYLIATTVFMLLLSWKLSLVALLFIPWPSIIGLRSGKIQSDRERTLTERWSSTFSRFHETLNLLKTVRSFGMEASEKERFSSQVRDINNVVAGGVKIDTRFDLAKQAALQLGRIVILFYGLNLVLSHQITLGTLIAFLTYLGALSGSVDAISRFSERLGKAKVYLQIACDLMNEDDEIKDRPEAKELERPVGEIKFDNVSFFRGERLIVDRINFCATPGKLQALVGPSGAGKSTLIDLLNRYMDWQKGSISIDGIDICSVTQKSLRSSIAVVLQDTPLFQDTIANNIRVGKPGASEDEVRNAAIASGAHDFIMQFPQGYTTVVGQRGQTVSGGERQRIAIARAILKDAPIVILDEATASLDSISEQYIQEMMDKLLRMNKTLIVIAHRLSTIKNADCITVLNDGRIVESGTHAQLIDMDGLYKQLVDKQSLARN